MTNHRDESRVAYMDPPNRTLPLVVSLFSGAGGLDLGFAQAGFGIAFATDKSASAVATHQKNFPDTVTCQADILEVGPRGMAAEVSKVVEAGSRIGVIGGPPCQGFSRANSASSAKDPRNVLTARYLETIEALQEGYTVEFVHFENVLGIRDAKHQVAFDGLLSHLERLGLHAVVRNYEAKDYAVPQNRTRVVVSAFRSPEALGAFDATPRAVIHTTVRDAIGTLPEATIFTPGLRSTDVPFHPNHWTMRPRSHRFKDPGAEAVAGRSFRRLNWDSPSPTVAYGHREIHVHPNGTRRLSILEAMLLQGFPDSFVLDGTLSSQVEQVSNAVPPPLARAVAVATDAALRAETVPETVGNVA